MIKLSYNEQRAYFSTGFKVRYSCATYMFQAIIKLEILQEGFRSNPVP